MQLSPGITRRTRQARRGYTLAELVVVITIMGVVGAVAIPRLASGNERFKAHRAAEAAADVLREVSLEARSLGEFRRVRIRDDVDWLAIRDDTQRLSKVDFTEPRYRADIAAVRLEDGTDKVDFDGFGYPNQSGVAVFTVSGYSRALMIDAQSGEIWTGSIPEMDAYETELAKR